MTSTRSMLAVVLMAVSVSAVKLWNSTADLPTTVPGKCRAAVTLNITCEFLVTAAKAANGRVVVGDAADEYCSDSCRSSLTSFQKKVTEGCGDNQYAFWRNSNQTDSAKALVDSLIWAQNLVCIEDDSGYCLADLYGGNRTACSDCALKYGAVMVSSDYGRQRYSEDLFKDTLSSCSVPASSYTYTYTPDPTSNPPTTTSSRPRPTCSGTAYTVKEGDTCESISKANSVATDNMIKANNLDYSCNGLTAGTELCIQNTCKVATIEEGQTCADILEGKGFSIIQLLSWNPTLKNMCDTDLTPNLDTLVGRSICIEAPGEYDFPTVTEPPTTTTETWRISSPYFTSWETGSVETKPDRGPVTMTEPWDPDYTPPAETITPNATRASIEAEYTRDCWITEADRENGFDDEEMSEVCQSLMSTYCTYESDRPSPTSLSRAPAICTPDRSWYSLEPNPDPVRTPIPTQVGMTKGCNAFYKVKSGDSCAGVASANDVALSDFYKWNPDVGTDCRNLQLNVYVCVGFDARLIPTPQPSATPTPA